MMVQLLISILLTVFNPSDRVKTYVLGEVNQLRASGCNCGGEWMEPVRPVKWNNILYKSAKAHAIEMREYDFFAHFSKDGKNIAERIESFGYDWQVVGENIGKGQQNFKEVFVDWIKSETHCKMLMNGNVDEMAVAKVGNYWVQHFGRKRKKGRR